RKLSSPMKSRLSPKGEVRKKERRSDSKAGQKKNARVTASCGSTSRKGNRRFLKTARFIDPRTHLRLVGRRELLQDLVALRDSVVELLLAYLRPRLDVLELPLDRF